MMLARDIAGWALLLGGCFFLIVGAVGLIRLPDVYAR
jgi:multisubunit Na+/H+ antiporter MnhG subunit